MTQSKDIYNALIVLACRTPSAIFYPCAPVHMSNIYKLHASCKHFQGLGCHSGVIYPAFMRHSPGISRVLSSETYERLKENGLLVLHLGDSKKCNMGSELEKRADPWFTVEDCFTESVEHCESHGIRDKGTVTGHTYLVLRAAATSR